MKRILFAYPEVSPPFRNGGIGTFVFEAAALLASTGRWEVDVLANKAFDPSNNGSFPEAKATFRRLGVRLLDVDRSSIRAYGWNSPTPDQAEQYERSISRLHAQRRYDVIEFPDWRAPGFFAVRRKLTAGAFADTRLVLHRHSSTREVWEWHGGDAMGRDDFYAQYMEDYVARRVDAVISPTEFLLAPLRAQGSSARLIQRRGYPIGARSPNAAPSASHRLTIACCSRLELRKGQDLLARAVQQLASSGVLENTHLVFRGRNSIGESRDGAMSETLRRLLRGYRDWEIAEPLERDALASWLGSEADICVVPSRIDNYPNVVIEAARAGCHLVCSDGGGIPEIIRDYDIPARVFPSGDVGALADALRSTIVDARASSARAQLQARFEAARQQQAAACVAGYDALAASPLPAVISDATPMVSIIIPYYNAHGHVRDAVRSAFSSKYPQFEVILVDDGSDNPESIATREALKSEFPALRVVEKANGGLGDARNAGIGVARGEYIVPLDADNMVLPDMLSRCSRVLASRPSLAYVTTYFECTNEAGSSRIPWQRSSIARPLGAVDTLLLLENTVGDALAMLRKSAVEVVGGYSTSVYCFEDWDLWLRLHERGLEGDVLPEVLFVYRLRDNSMHRGLDAYHGQRLHQALLRQHGGLMRDQSMAIATLLLQEYWPRWRPTTVRRIGGLASLVVLKTLRRIVARFTR